MAFSSLEEHAKIIAVLAIQIDYWEAQAESGITFARLGKLVQKANGDLVRLEELIGQEIGLSPTEQIRQRKKRTA